MLEEFTRCVRACGVVPMRIIMNAMPGNSTAFVFVTEQGSRFAMTTRQLAGADLDWLYSQLCREFAIATPPLVLTDDMFVSPSPSPPTVTAAAVAKTSATNEHIADRFLPAPPVDRVKLAKELALHIKDHAANEMRWTPSEAAAAAAATDPPRLEESPSSTSSTPIATVKMLRTQSDCTR